MSIAEAETQLVEMEIHTPQTPPRFSFNINAHIFTARSRLGALSESLNETFLQNSFNHVYLTLDEALAAFYDAGYPLCMSQLFEIYHHVKPIFQREQGLPTFILPTDPVLFFGEFCWIICLIKQIHFPNGGANKARVQAHNLKDKLAAELERKKVHRQHQVFLGGSCNPTTWRRVQVIPVLDQHSISYYNPQVSEI